MTKRQKFFSALKRFLKDLFTKNLTLKIVALLFALLLWGYVLAEVKPVYTKRMRDLTVELQNEDALQNSGWILTDPVIKVDVDLDAEIDKHNELDENNVICSYDCSQLQIPEQQEESIEVQVEVTVRHPDYATKKKVSYATLKLERIEERRDIPLELVLPKEQSDSFLVVNRPTDLKAPKVTGPGSVTEKIDRAVVEIDYSMLEDLEESAVDGTITFDKSLPVRYLDADGNVLNELDENGNAVNSEFAFLTGVETVIKNLVFCRCRDFPISVDVKPDSDFDEDLYTVEYELANGAEKTIRLYGSSRALERQNEIWTDRITPQQEESVDTVTVDLILPSSLRPADGIETPTTSVYVKVAKRVITDSAVEIEINYTEPDQDVSIVNKSDDKLKITVSGTKDAMDAFRSEWISASVDLGRLGGGTYELPVALTFNGTDLHLQDFIVTSSEENAPSTITIRFKSETGTYIITIPQWTVEVVLEENESGEITG